MYQRISATVEGPADNADGPIVRGQFAGVSRIGTVAHVIVMTDDEQEPVKLIPAYAVRVITSERKDAPLLQQ